jgi:hypothetical protein
VRRAKAKHTCEIVNKIGLVGDWVELSRQVSGA